MAHGRPAVIAASGPKRIEKDTKMTIQKLMTTAATATLIAAATTAAADDKASVAVFYELLSNPGSSELAEDFKDVTLENWESIESRMTFTLNRKKERDKELFPYLLPQHAAEYYDVISGD